MRMPPRGVPPKDEQDLHRRALRRDPVTLSDLYGFFAQQITQFLRDDLGCEEYAADNAIFDTFLAYVEQPERYDPQKGRLLSYLTLAAKCQVRDRRRSEISTARREREFGRVVELWRRTPKEEMENLVEAIRALERIVKRGQLKDERDVAFLGLILRGERSTERLAEVLGLGSLPLEQMRRAVKRHRDRLMKILERFGKEDSDEPA
ncbi:sigma-70 family RNA polymerase sigma factor [Cystobacter fuscus]|uniref:sigma-70 family RNA polymerase sigma factor n=1 Tax=Cystobacter fuscus TaxID=43 RepID=UPI002B2D0EEF|nr:sigma-70 family RNA polymerase sigma factor [Cystobacter fuscus]